MTAILQGVRILEVAEHTFVPAASALLSDWGAEVIKIEHVERGDAMRGLASTGIAVVPNNVHVLLEHSNRGKKSLALDLTSADGLDILYKLAATCDVFLTNKLPERPHRSSTSTSTRSGPTTRTSSTCGAPARASGAPTPTRARTTRWRSGPARAWPSARMRPEYDLVPVPPAPGFGDSIGGMTIAGGIMGALFHRERTGEATTVDVSLLGRGPVGHGPGASRCRSCSTCPGGRRRSTTMGANPLSRNYETKDGHVLAFTCLQAAKYWPPLCECIGRPDLATDPRFADHASLMANSPRPSRS